MDANLIVTFDPSHAGKAKEEVISALEDAGEKAVFFESDVQGLFLLKAKNPKELVKNLRAGAGRLEYTFHWIPVEKWCSSDLDALAEEMKKINARIDPKESWKIDIGKRCYGARTTDLIIKLTENIDKPRVDLKNPDKIVKVEIIGDKAAIALLDKGEILDVPKMKGKT